jgi:biopolymer transport protein ExbD
MAFSDAAEKSVGISMVFIFKRYNQNLFNDDMDFLKYPTLIKKTMAQLQLQPVSTGKKNRTRKAPLKIDMTPLVDLGFLLITFFIFTTTMSKPTVTKLFMPANGDSTRSSENLSLTILLNGNDSIYYFHGKWDEAVASNEVYRTNFNVASGIGKIIREKQKILGERKDELMFLIKPLENSSYNSLMNALDEVMICHCRCNRF